MIRGKSYLEAARGAVPFPEFKAEADPALDIVAIPSEELPGPDFSKPFADAFSAVSCDAEDTWEPAEWSWELTTPAVITAEGIIIFDARSFIEDFLPAPALVADPLAGFTSLP